MYLPRAFRSIFLLSEQKKMKKNIKMKFIEVVGFPLAFALFNSG